MNPPSLFRILVCACALWASINSTGASGDTPARLQSERAILTPVLGNYPDTSVAISGNTTVTPDAAPGMTTRINVSTSTNYKGKLEGDSATGVVRVTDAHPAGTYTVTVKAFDTGGVSATKTFTVTVTTPVTCVPVSFGATANYGAGSLPRSVAVGDFNGDGKQDLAVANLGGNPTTVSVLLGDGAGNFSPAMNFASGGFSLAVGDFNRDGKQDLATTDTSMASVLLGNGDGTFSAATHFAAGSVPIALAVGDFNGDGKQDLVAADDVSPGSVKILLGNGEGSFSAPSSFDAGGYYPISVAVGDFNSDGNQDVVVANNSTNTVSVLLGNGNGTFQPAVSYGAGISLRSVAVGDFNDDGKQDLAVANEFSQNVSILLGDGLGHFSAATNFGSAASPLSVAVGDFNGDGKQDLAVANEGSKVSVLLGNGSGSFSPATNFNAGSDLWSVAVGDFNGDGKQDLGLANNGSNGVSVLLRNCALTPTSVLSRKTHGDGGSFDIELPLIGSPGVECRTSGGTNDYTLVITFSGNVTVTGNPQAQVTSGAATVGSGGVSNGGIVNVNGNVATIPLTNVADAQTISVTLNNVNGSANVTIPMSILVGDTNGNGTVNASDASQTKSRIGQTVDATNFRSDVNANGSINATDVSLVKSAIGTGLP